VFNSVASQPSPEQLAQLRALARQQFATAPHPQPVPQAAAPAPVQYQGVQPGAPPAPKTIKAGAIGFAAQQPAGPQVVYQAYQQ
jgi:hypothetical protein